MRPLRCLLFLALTLLWGQAWASAIEKLVVHSLEVVDATLELSGEVEAADVAGTELPPKAQIILDLRWTSIANPGLTRRVIHRYDLPASVTSRLGRRDTVKLPRLGAPWPEPPTGGWRFELVAQLVAVNRDGKTEERASTALTGSHVGTRFDVQQARRLDGVPENVPEPPLRVTVTADLPQEDPRPAVPRPPDLPSAAVSTVEPQPLRPRTDSGVQPARRLDEVQQARRLDGVPELGAENFRERGVEITSGLPQDRRPNSEPGFAPQAPQLSGEDRRRPDLSPLTRTTPAPDARGSGPPVSASNDLSAPAVRTIDLPPLVATQPDIPPITNTVLLERDRSPITPPLQASNDLSAAVTTVEVPPLLLPTSSQESGPAAPGSPPGGVTTIKLAYAGESGGGNPQQPNGPPRTPSDLFGPANLPASFPPAPGTPPPPPAGPTVLDQAVPNAFAMTYVASGQFSAATAGPAAVAVQGTGAQLESFSFTNTSPGNVVTVGRGTTQSPASETGGDSLITWGRWTSGTMTGNGPNVPFGTGATFNANQGFHYVVGAATSVAGMNALTTGTAAFTLIGATNPTFGDGLGATGTFTGSLNVAWGGAASTRVGVDFTIAMPGDASYRMVSSGGLGSPASSQITTSGGSAFTGNLTGNVTVTPAGGTGRACAGPCTAGVSGFFAGPAAERAGVGYSIGNTPAALQGTAAFRR